MLNDEEIHGRWNKEDQRYVDGCEPGDTHEEVSIHALINHGPIVSDPNTLWIPDGQTYDDGYEAGRRQGRWEAFNEAADLVQNHFARTALRELVKAELVKDPWEGFTGQSRADAEDAEITDPIIRQLSESRARYADMEARVVELEAVVRAVDDWFNDLGSKRVPNGEALARLLDRAPFVVLADHDAAVWDQGYARGKSDHCDCWPTFEYCGITADNPYRGDTNG